MYIFIYVLNHLINAYQYSILRILIHSTYERFFHEQRHQTSKPPQDTDHYRYDPCGDTDSDAYIQLYVHCKHLQKQRRSSPLIRVYGIDKPARLYVSGD